MKFLTDDDRFGIIVAPTAGRSMFRFRLAIDGRVLGDSEPCIIGSAMKQLRHLNGLEDRRLAPDLCDPSALMQLLKTDDELHDATMLSLAESLDNWLLYGYKYDSRVVLVAKEYRLSETSGEVLTAIIDASIYDSVIEMSRTHWALCEASRVE